jgi:hypothetical protein
LRFQADAARLLSVMVVLNAMCAMILVPCWALVFKPRFITAMGEKRQEVAQAVPENVASMQYDTLK